MLRILSLTAAGITVIALLFAGFAMLAPEPVDAPAEAASLSLPAGRGSASGRLASMSFIAVASTAQAQISSDSVDSTTFEALMVASFTSQELATGPQPTTTTSTTTTTTAAPATTTTVAPATTTTTTVPVTTTTTAPPSTTTTVPSSGPLTEAQMTELAARFFPPEEVEKAVLVAWCESNYNPNAYNSRGPYGGLYQHLETYWASRAAAAGYPGASIFDAEANTAAAHLLWSSNGWGPWPSCSAWADGQLGG